MEVKFPINPTTSLIVNARHSENLKDLIINKADKGSTIVVQNKAD